MSHTTLKSLSALADQLGLSVTNKNALDSFYFTCRLRGLSKHTMRGYAERLGYLIRFAHSQNKDLLTLTKADFQKYVSSLIDCVAAITINGRIIVYKVFYKHLRQEGFIDVDPLADIRKMKEPKVIKDVLSTEDYSRILAQLNRRTFNGCRDHAMLLFCFDSLVRLSELLAIRTDQIDLQSGVVKVTGKGGKERVVVFNPQTAKVIHAYLTRFRQDLPGDLLFCMRNGQPITHRRAQRIFAIPAQKIGLHLHPHLARHSGASAFIAGGGSVAILQRALGHASLAITQRYVHLSNQDIVKEYIQHSPAAGIRI